MISCVVCGSSCQFFWGDKRRDYWRCLQCQCIHVPRPFHLSETEEKQEYDKHENNLEDEGYLNFLRRAAKPLLERLPPASEGLDFGCGPGPALKKLLEQGSHRVTLFDKFYYPDNRVLSLKYHFITLTEVVEHLANPVAILDVLWQQLLTGGWLLLMTKRVSNPEAFQSWHYKNDPTHITFFHQATMEHLAARWNTTVTVVSSDVVLFQKP